MEIAQCLPDILCKFYMEFTYHVYFVQCNMMYGAVNWVPW